MAHKEHQVLEAELRQAKEQVKVGGVYAHFKHPDNLYTVIDIGVQEASDEICVIYRAEYNRELTFVRNLSSWLETPEVNGVLVPRFKLIES